MNEQSNIYLPHLMVIEKITHEAPGVKTFRLKFKDEKEEIGRASCRERV